MPTDYRVEALSDFFSIASADLDEPARTRSNRISQWLRKDTFILAATNLVIDGDELVLELLDGSAVEPEDREPFVLDWRDASTPTREAWERYLDAGGPVQRLDG